VTPEAIAARLRSAGVPVESIAAVTPSLEDVFLDVIDRAGRDEAKERERLSHARGAGR
jgi:hypothetical protein